MRLVMFLLVTLLASCTGTPKEDPAAGPASSRIEPWPENPMYWQLDGGPVLLLGGTKDDNLFQIPDLEEHLDLLASVGGNYIRNTMSDREDKDYVIHAFHQLDDGTYDLDQWNDEYWRRFENLIRLTGERRIVVQIEVWDRFDHAQQFYEVDPFRPSNNINYTSEETGLAEEYERHPSRDDQPFFHTIPGMERYEQRFDRLRHYQERFVEKMLSYTLDQGHVLYCMNNETSTPPAWGRYWMEFIRAKAAAAGVTVWATDMFDDGWKPEQSEKLRQAFAQPATYPFVDISQVNSRNFGQDHWDRVMWLHAQVAGQPRPLNNVKIYGDGDSSWGSGLPKDGVERFWRHLIAGSASVRFHRDGAGTGLQPISQASIRAARMVESAVKLWDVEPMMELLSDRKENEAYVAAKAGEKYLVYFTDGGSATLNLDGASSDLQLRWVEIASGEWQGEPTRVTGGQHATLAAPGPGGWVAVITR
jgi:hypothetical protein